MRKHIMLLSATVLVAVSSMAQFQKGDKTLGLGLDISSTSNKTTSGSVETSQKGFFGGLSAELGMASSANRLNGFYLSGGFGSSKSETSSTVTQNYYNAGGGYFTRKYMPLSKSFYVFGDGRIGVGIGGQQSDPASSTLKSFNATARIFPGVAYKWNKNVLLEVRFADLLNAGYSRQKTTGSGTTSVQSGFNLSSNLGLGYLQNFGIGARWIIGNKKAS